MLCYPILRSRVMANQKRVLAVRANRTNGSLDAVVADVDAAIGQDAVETGFGQRGQRGSRTLATVNQSSMTPLALPEISLVRLAKGRDFRSVSQARILAAARSSVGCAVGSPLNLDQ